MIDSKQPTAAPCSGVDRLAQDLNTRVINQEQIARYLARFPDVTGVTRDLLRDARTEFGPDAEILLQLYSDPEIEDEHLKVCVRVAQYTKEIRQSLQSIAAAYEEQLAAISGYVSISTDYRPVSTDAL